MISSTSSSVSTFQLAMDILSGQQQSSTLSNLFRRTDSNSLPQSLQQISSPTTVERAIKNSAAKGIDLAKLLSPQTSSSNSFNFSSFEESVINTLFNPKSSFSSLNVQAFAPAALQELARIWGSAQQPGQIVNRTA